MKQSEPCSESQRRCWALSSRKEIDRLSGQLALFKTKLCILWEWNLANTINVFFFFFSFYTVILFLNVLILNLDQMEFCLWWWILLYFIPISTSIIDIIFMAIWVGVNGLRGISLFMSYVGRLTLDAYLC